MLNRQRILLAIARETGRPVSRTVFVKLAFLARHETSLREDRTFYDFAPHLHGPFSFALGRELSALRRISFFEPGEESVSLSASMEGAVETERSRMRDSDRSAVTDVVGRFGGLDQRSLIAEVYRRYPWYATRSQLTDLVPADMPVRELATPAVCTVGYEGRSVDALFDQLLRRGIETLVDVRANPVSMKYGFARKTLAEISRKLGIEYLHRPALGIPPEQRSNLSGFDSYQHLLARYESDWLPGRREDVDDVARLMTQRPSAIMCFERDVRCCHRSRLATALSRSNGLPVEHL